MNGLGISFASKLVDLADCLCLALKTNGAGPTCFCGVVPGASPAWDYCGECSGETCGMGYIRVISAFQSSSFPVADDPGEGCTGPLVVQLGVGALRCVPVPNESGELPAEEQQVEATLGLLADMSAMFVALCECLPDGAIGAYEPLGPSGACAGGEWTVWMSL